MPSLNKPVQDEFAASRLNGAAFFYIDEICDKTSSLPHMVPTNKQFEDQVSELGISNTDHVICYDSGGQYMASARVWWMFHLFGHHNVQVLEKGFTPALFSDVPELIASGPADKPKKTCFISTLERQHLTTLNDILNEPRSFQIVDARSSERFYAQAPEPRPMLEGGHIPGSFNVPFGTILSNGALVESEKMKTLFGALDLSKPVVTTCGSGVTAAVLSLGLASIGKSTSVYDGSWSEYGQLSLGLPVEKQ